MSWFNYYGLIFIVAIMLPNIVYAIKCKVKFQNLYQNKAVEIFEQIGRFGCLIFMVFNIPYMYFNFWFASALIVYLTINSILCLAYLIAFFILWNRKGRFKALLLSILPSAVFIFSSIMLSNIPLVVFAVMFAICHILLSYKNAFIGESND